MGIHNQIYEIWLKPFSLKHPCGWHTGAAVAALLDAAEAGAADARKSHAV